MGIAYIQVITSSRSPEHVSSLFVTCSEPAKIANIVGEFNLLGALLATSGWYGASCSGCFGFDGEVRTWTAGSHTANSMTTDHRVRFDSSRYSPIYSDDTDALNPNSVKVLLIIRY